MKRTKSLLHRLYFVISLVLVLWSFTFIIHQLSDSLSVVFFRITVCLTLVFFVLLCHSYIVFTGSRWKRAIPAILYSGCLIIAGITLLTPENAVFMRRYGFLLREGPFASPLFVLQTLFCLVSGILSVVLLFIRALRTKEAVGRRIVSLHLIAAIGCFALYFTGQLVLPLVSTLVSLYFSPVFFTVWAAAVLYSMTAFGFLSADGVHSAAGQAKPLPEYSVLVDAEGSILEANNQTEIMLRRTTADLVHRHLKYVVKRPESIIREIKRMAEANLEQTICPITWISGNNEQIAGRSRITAARNSLGRAKGFLITPLVRGEIEELKKSHSLTEREIEVMHFAVKGLRNGMIAKELAITERTVKAHLTNIYNKLGINNKFQLIDRLKDIDI
ncbi:MAG: hypothetical protein JW874_02155 [Spirochaetales bacterium]|nr:hypothetical protein [Spirochaetales bacterium]